MTSSDDDAAEMNAILVSVTVMMNAMEILSKPRDLKMMQSLQDDVDPLYPSTGRQCYGRCFRGFLAPTQPDKVKKKEESL